MLRADLKIVDLNGDDDAAIRQAAALLYEGFRNDWPGSWPDMPSALDEVRESLRNDGASRIAVNDRGEVLGWIGGCPDYDGNIWELHPLVVREDMRGQGIGAALVADLESLARRAGAYTLFLGSDDVTAMTSLGNVDLYEETWAKIADIRSLRGHPFAFYLKQGYKIVGVLPDANGPGKPDIFLAKRLL